jgi:hypothetical protein
VGNNQILTPTDPVIDPVTQFGYPATANVAVFNGGVSGNGMHLIQYTADPAALFNNAPNGSICVDTTNGDWYIKTAAATWTKASP